MTPPFRFGVDVGGTYTDLVAADADGALTVVKTPSVPVDPTAGVITALGLAAERLSISVRTLLEACPLFVHGTTIATNTLLTRSGARVGLLTTAGFRDWLAIRRGMRENPWAHREPNPEPLVPRYRRIGIPGRLDAEGREIEPLDLAAIEAACAGFKSDRVESVAICFLHAYRNPAHERAAAAKVRQCLPGAAISLSAEIAATVGEYERGGAAVMNAYLAPKVTAYLRAMATGLAEAGLKTPLLLLQSNGGAAPVDQIADQPVRLLLSGPAAGVGALDQVAAALGVDNLIAMEIGGTSCDVTLMADRRVELIDEQIIEGHHLSIPTVDIHTVGAGGGTIAHAVSGSLIAGPDGAGARPGPAAYGRGGTQATITDALVVLGRLRPGPQAGGAVTLDAELARAAIAREIAGPLGLSVERAASGMVAVMEQNLLHAVERMSIERGRDPRGFTLVAAGGAGPMHGTAVARRLGIKDLVLPRLAGAFCALGLLTADLRRDFGLAALLPLEGVASLVPQLAALGERAAETLAASGFDGASLELEPALDLRYRGQQWDVRVTLGRGRDAFALDPARIRAQFEATHQRLYGHIQPGGELEVTGLKVSGVGRFPSAATRSLPAARRAPSPIGQRAVWLGDESEPRALPIYDGAALAPGPTLTGPLIIEEATTTLLIDGPDQVTLHPAGLYRVSLA
ncbi:MAG: hydantoinase/oxoprolinase family protein [Elsteraceae bacterium]